MQPILFTLNATFGGSDNTASYAYRAAYQGAPQQRYVTPDRSRRVGGWVEQIPTRGEARRSGGGRSGQPIRNVLRLVRTVIQDVPKIVFTPKKFFKPLTTRRMQRIIWRGAAGLGAGVALGWATGGFGAWIGSIHGWGWGVAASLGSTGVAEWLLQKTVRDDLAGDVFHYARYATQTTSQLYRVGKILEAKLVPAVKEYLKKEALNIGKEFLKAHPNYVYFEGQLKLHKYIADKLLQIGRDAGVGKAVSPGRLIPWAW